MNKALLLACLSITFLACNNKKSNTIKNQNNLENTRTIGGQKDKHGCLKAAGETWSTLQKDCIRVFKIGQRLNPVSPSDTGTTYSAFIIFNSDKSKIELFLPTKKDGSIILNLQEDKLYKNKTYTFNTKENALYLNDIKIFAQ